MSLLGSKVGVISLGMSCQSSHQIELHARLIAELAGDRSAKVSRFPFDNIICSPQAAGRMLQADRFYPQAPEELAVSESGGFLQHAEQWRNPDPTSNHHHWRFSLRQNEAAMGAVDGNPRAWLNETELIGAIPCFLDHEAKPR